MRCYCAFFVAFAKHCVDCLVDTLACGVSPGIVASGLYLVDVEVGIEILVNALEGLWCIVGAQADGNTALKDKAIEKALGDRFLFAYFCVSHVCFPGAEVNSSENVP